MKTLKEMNMGELRALFIQWRDLYCEHGAENFRENALEVESEYLSRIAESEPVIEEMKVINVFYETGYKWSVSVEDESESRVTFVNKSEAMRIARNIKNDEFNEKAVIEAETLNRKQRAENMSWLHQNTLAFGTENYINR